jgi:4-hydroxy-2-oxoheptanedioate aldolase
MVASGFRERLAGREFLLGSFGIELSGGAVPHALAQSGFDLLIIDTEHSSFSLEQVANQVAACRAAGIASVVRVADNSRSSITRVADIWPDGIMFPGVESVVEARAIVAAAKYSPTGQRGVCPMVQYSALPPAERYAILNERLALILQVEGASALEEAPGIAEVDGVDALFVGTYDLSQSLGIPGQLNDPRVFEAGRRLREALPASTALGVYVQSAEAAHQWLAAGVSLVAFATDGQLFLAACHDAAASVRSTTPSRTP